MGSVRVVLSVGGNCGNRVEAVSEAMAWLATELDTPCSSSVYETKPIGNAGNNYMNGVIAGEFDGTVEELSMKCKAYEISHGRDDEARRRGDVPVDIDIVIADDVILRPRDFGCSFFQQGYSELNILMPGNKDIAR